VVDVFVVGFVVVGAAVVNKMEGSY